MQRRPIFNKRQKDLFIFSDAAVETGTMKEKTKVSQTILFTTLASLSLIGATVLGQATEGAAGLTRSPAAAHESEVLKFVARFHLVLLHFPIGLLGGAALLELYSLFRPARNLAGVKAFVLTITSVSGIIVSLMGLALAQEGGYDPETLSRHQWLGLTVVALVVVTTLVHRKVSRQGGPRRLTFAYRGLLGSAVFVLMLAGHEGGNLTHGSQYLLQHAPSFVKRLFAEGTSTLGSAHQAGDENRGMPKAIATILESACVQCHGREKQKGGYRLDVKSVAFAGGDSELTAIVPGRPLESNLVRLLLLSPTDDDVMPPQGKGDMTAEEILTVIRWIEAGAPFGDDASSPKSDPADPTHRATTTHAEGLVTATVGSLVAVETAPSSGVVSNELTPRIDDTPKADAARRLPAEGTSPAVGETATGAERTGKVDFQSEIQPILARHCVRCHGADKRRGRLRLHTWDDALDGGKKKGPAIVAGKPEESPLYLLAAIDPANDDDEELMPPDGKGRPLTEDELETLALWIKQGAEWPEGLSIEEENEEEVEAK